MTSASDTGAPPLDMQPEHWQLVLRILQQQVPQHEVWAFGSRARGRAKPYSDLDIAILGRQPLPLGTLAALQEAFTESDLPWKVDVVDWASATEAFQRIIERDHVVIALPHS